MKYKVYMTQYVTARVAVEIEIESDKDTEELEEEIYDAIEDWTRLSRFDPDIEEFPGSYVAKSYKYDLATYGPGDEIEVYIEKNEVE
jgi:transcription elongation factor